jgi:hypothetical protein
MIEIQIVGEEPVATLTDAVKEGVANKHQANPWQRLEGEITQSDGEVEPLRFNLQGKAFPFAESTGAQAGTLKVTWIGGRKPHVCPLRYRIHSEDGTKVLDDPEVTGGETLKVRISTRLRLSILHFFIPFLDPDNATRLDEDLLDMVKDAHVDDVSIVSVVKFAEDPGHGNPRVVFTGEWWPMDKVTYLSKLIEACH